MTARDLVPAPWRDAFVVAMRERDADGRRIGDALAEVQQFCADSGQDATEAFGEPDELAAGLLAAPVVRRRGRDLRRSAPDLVGLAGMLLVLWAVTAEGGVVEVTVGHLVAAVAVAAGALVVAGLLAAGRRGLGVVCVVAGVLLGAALAPVVLTAGTVLTLPARTAVGIGAVLLVGEAGWQTLRERRAPTADVVADPDEPAELVHRRNVRWSVGAAWLMPAFTVVGVLVLVALDRLSGA
jgi:hypothetical protein